MPAHLSGFSSGGHGTFFFLDGKQQKSVFSLNRDGENTTPKGKEEKRKCHSELYTIQSVGRTLVVVWPC